MSASVPSGGAFVPRGGGQAALAGVDGLTPGGQQTFPLRLSGHLGGGPGGMACQDRAQMVGYPDLGLGGAGLVERVGGCPDILGHVREVQQNMDRDAAEDGPGVDQIALVTGTIDQDNPRPQVLDIDRGSDHEPFQPALTEHVTAAACHRVVGLVERAAEGFGHREPR